jgi:hypothetical protein
MRTSKQFILAIITSLSILSCDSNDDNDVNTVCNSNFIAFTSTKYFPSATDDFDIFKYPKSTTLNFGNVVDLTPNSNPFLTAEYLFNNTTLFNPTSQEFICHLPTHSRILKYNVSTGIVTNNSYPINSGIGKPFLSNGVLKFLKFSNYVNTYSTVSSQNYISSFNVQIADENGLGSGTNYALSFQESDGVEIENSSAFEISNKIFFISGCTIVIIDTSLNTIEKRNLYNYDYSNNRLITRGLHLKNNNTLVFLKAEIVPVANIKIEEINLTSLLSSSTNYTPQTLFNFNNATLSGTNPTTVSLIINRIDGSSFAFDKCDSNYYFTSDDGAPNAPEGYIYEFKTNSNEMNVYPKVIGKHFFGMGIEQ